MAERSCKSSRVEVHGVLLGPERVEFGDGLGVGEGVEAFFFGSEHAKDSTEQDVLARRFERMKNVPDKQTFFRTVVIHVESDSASGAFPSWCLASKDATCILWKRRGSNWHFADWLHNQ